MISKNKANHSYCTRIAAGVMGLSLLATLLVGSAHASAAEEDRTSCDEIRGTEYRSEAEREFFQENCVAVADSSPAPAPVAEEETPSPPPADDVADADEAAYRSKAAAQIGYLQARLAQYYGTSSYGITNDILDAGAIARNLANTLDSITPVPPRFRAVHDELRDAHAAFADFCLTVKDVDNLSEAIDFIATLDEHVDRMNAAIEDYELVVGVKLVGD